MSLFLKTYWPMLLTGASILGLVVSLLIVTAQRDAARAERDAEIVRTTTMSAQIERQNDGIRAMVEASKQGREIYLAGLKAAENKAVRLTVEAEDILALPAPTNPDEACAAAAGVLKGVTQ